jgi:hypothetical protein
MQNFTFYIHCKNEYDAHIISIPIYVQVNYNCSFDKMWYDDSKP